MAFQVVVQSESDQMPRSMFIIQEIQFTTAN